MMINRDIIKNLINDIQLRMRPFDQQKTIRQDRWLWCSDWYAIEILKCLYWTPSAYRLDPLPCRLKNNPAFPGREYIVTRAEEIMKTIEEADNVDIIRLIEDGFDTA